MTVPKTLPAPRRNQTDAGMASRFDDIASADILVLAGDYTGGASEDLFTLSAHGLLSGDVVLVLGQSAQGAFSGSAGYRAIAKVLSSSTLQLTADGTTVIENTADGTVYAVKANGMRQGAADAIASRMVLAGNDTTGGTVEDMMSVQSMGGLIEGDTLKLLYKSAAGAAAVAVDSSVYVKSPVNTVSATAVTSYCQTSATSGGAVLDTTADGTLLWIKTS